MTSRPCGPSKGVKSVMGKRQRDPLGYREGEVNLILIRGNCHLGCHGDVADPDEIKATKIVGVDRPCVLSEGDGSATVWLSRRER